MSERGASWYVKTDDGNEYGPVALDKLIGWARDGRIEPTSEISSDRIKWSPAPLLPDLGMRWIVETEFGRYFGPFHPDLVKELFDKKRVPPASRTFCLNDGADAAAYRKSQEELSAARCDLASAADREKTLKAEVRGLETRLNAAADEARRTQSELTATLEKAKRDLDELKAQSEKKVAALNAALATATTANETWSAQDAKRERECAKLTSQLSAAKAEARQHEQELQDGFAAELDEAKQSAAAREKELRSQHAAELDEAKQSAATREKELQGELAATKADLERLSAKAAKDISELRNEAQAREAELASSLATAEAATKALQKSAEASANAAAEKIAALEASLAEATAANAEWAERDEKRNQAMKAAEKELAESRKAQAAAEQRLEDAQRKLERFAKKGGGLFSGKSASDLAALELAARRELAAAKRRPFGGAFGGRREPVAAIDVDAKEL